LINQLAAGFSTWSMTMAATTPNAVSLGWRIIAALSQSVQPASIGYFPLSARPALEDVIVIDHVVASR
jgi:hypothetical protein